MEIKITKLPKSKVGIFCFFTPEETQPFLNKALEEISKTIKVNGFRPTKIPQKLLFNKVPQEEINRKTTELVLQKKYLQFIAEYQIKALDDPEIISCAIFPDHHLEFTIEVSVFPSFQLPNYREIAKSLSPQRQRDFKIKEEEINEVLKWLQHSRAKLEKVNRPPVKNDVLLIDFEIKENGVLLENGKATNFLFETGKGNFLPGFEDELLKINAGEETNFSLTVPENWWQENLRGKTLNINCSLKEVQEKTLPLLNDEFARTLGDFTDFLMLKKSIEEGLTLEKVEKEKQRFRLLILDKILEQIEMEIPEVLKKWEIEKMLEELKLNLNKMQLSLEQYLRQIKKTENELLIDFQELANKRVKSALVLKQIAEIEQIKVPIEEIQLETESFLNRLMLNNPQIQNNLQHLDRKEIEEYTKNCLRTEKVLQLLENI